MEQNGCIGVARVNGVFTDSFKQSTFKTKQNKIHSEIRNQLQLALIEARSWILRFLLFFC